LRGRHGVEATTSNPDAVRGAELVVVAVKPQDIDTLLAEIGPLLSADQTVLSVAAAIRTQHIEERIADGVPVVRAMPNSPSTVHEGMAGICAGAQAGDAQLALAEEALLHLGRVVRVPESSMDAVTALSGSGPAYFALLAEAMIEAGILLGVSRGCRRPSSCRRCSERRSSSATRACTRRAARVRHLSGRRRSRRPRARAARRPRRVPQRDSSGDEPCAQPPKVAEGREIEIVVTADAEARRIVAERLAGRRGRRAWSHRRHDAEARVRADAGLERDWSRVSSGGATSAAHRPTTSARTTTWHAGADRPRVRARRQPCTGCAAARPRRGRLQYEEELGDLQTLRPDAPRPRAGRAWRSSEPPNGQG
jgi:hypothetical protein